MRTKIKMPDIVILITIASTTLYMISRNIPLGAGSFTFLWAPLSLLLILSTRPATFIKGSMRLLLLYGVIAGILQYTLWRFMDDWNQVRILYEVYYLIVITAILGYYWSMGEFKMLALLGKWIFIFIVITLITTNIALYFDPTLVRESARTGEYTELQGRLYKLSGAMGYSYVQAIVCLIPILIYHIKNKKKMVFGPKTLLAILIIILITQIRAQVFANVLVTALITVISILGSKRRSITFILITFFGILFILIPNSFYADSISSLSTYFKPDSEMYYKLNDFAKFIENPDIDASTGAGSRAERYPILYEAFVASPLLGNASYNSTLDISPGAHLYWMNRLAIWGAPGFLFFIFVLYKIYKSISSLFDAEYKFYYLLSVLALILLGLIKTIGGREPWLILILTIPGLYFLPLLSPIKRYNKVQKPNVPSLPAKEELIVPS